MGSYAQAELERRLSDEIANAAAANKALDELRSGSADASALSAETERQAEVIRILEVNSSALKRTCIHAHAHVRACMHACVRVRVRVCASARTNKYQPVLPRWERKRSSWLAKFRKGRAEIWTGAVCGRRAVPMLNDISHVIETCTSGSISGT